MMNNTPANATERLARLDPVYQREALGALQAAEARMSADFIERVHSLTPELYEMVKGYIFHSGCAFHIERQVVKVDKDYRPPALLQVDRHTRLCTLFHYYHRCIFEVCDEETLMKWLRPFREREDTFSLLLYEIRCDTRPKQQAGPDTFSSGKSSEYIEKLREKLQERAQIVETSKLYFRLFVRVWDSGQNEMVWVPRPIYTGMSMPRRDECGFLIGP